MKEVVELEIEGLIKPKARPRFNGETTYLPEDYRQWKETTTIELIRQIKNKKIEVPIKGPIHLVIEYYGRAQGDLDNIAGAIMDALVNAKIIDNDNVKHIPKLSIEFERTSIKSARTIIKIYKINKNKSTSPCDHKNQNQNQD